MGAESSKGKRSYPAKLSLVNFFWHREVVDDDASRPAPSQISRSLPEEGVRLRKFSQARGGLMAPECGAWFLHRALGRVGDNKGC